MGAVHWSRLCEHHFFDLNRRGLDNAGSASTGGNRHGLALFDLPRCRGVGRNAPGARDKCQTNLGGAIIRRVKKRKIEVSHAYCAHCVKFGEYFSGELLVTGSPILEYVPAAVEDDCN